MMNNKRYNYLNKCCTAYAIDSTSTKEENALYSRMGKNNKNIQKKHSFLKQFLFSSIYGVKSSPYKVHYIPPFSINKTGFFNELSFHYRTREKLDIIKLVTVLKHLDELIKTSGFIGEEPNRYKYLKRAEKDKTFHSMAFSFHVVKDNKGYFPVLFLIKERESGGSSLHFIRVGRYMDKDAIEKISMKKEVTPAVTHSPYSAIDGKENSDDLTSDSNNGRLVTSALTIAQWALFVNEADAKIFSYFPDEFLTHPQIRKKKNYLATQYIKNFEKRLEENRIVPLTENEKEDLFNLVKENIEKAEGILNKVYNERSRFKTGSPLEILKGETSDKKTEERFERGKERQYSSPSKKGMEKKNSPAKEYKNFSEKKPLKDSSTRKKKHYSSRGSGNRTRKYPSTELQK